MTYADVIPGGYLYLKSENTTETYVLNGVDPITYEYYTITWTQDGETIATETWREGCTPVAPVPPTYVDGDWEYTLVTAVVEVTGNATYEIVYEKTYVGESISGDVNGDAGVTIADVAAALDMIAGKADVTDFADINGDGGVSIADVAAILDIIAGK